MLHHAQGWVNRRCTGQVLKNPGLPSIADMRYLLTSAQISTEVSGKKKYSPALFSSKDREIYVDTYIDTILSKSRCGWESLMRHFSYNNSDHKNVLSWVFSSVYFCVGPKHLSGHQVISPFLRGKRFRRWLMELMESHFSSDAWKQVILKIDLLFLVAIDHTLKVSLKQSITQVLKLGKTWNGKSSQMHADVAITV